MRKILSFVLAGVFLLSLCSFISAEVNVAYVVKNSSLPDFEFIGVIQDIGVDYTIIDSSLVVLTDFSDYSMILLGNEKVDGVPTDSFPSVFADRDYTLDWSSRSGTLTSSQPLRVNVSDSEHFITEDFEDNFQVYTDARLNGLSVPMSYIYGIKYGAEDLVTTTNDKGEYVVAIKDDPKRVFFGISKSEYWTNESRALFKKSIEWVLGAEDEDGDGYSGLNGDCDDEDASINPGAEDIPYDGIDQDCSGGDLIDVDEDGFDSPFAGGDDCNDNNASINPGSSDPLLNCVNDAPIQIANISELVWEEGESFELNLSEYFVEPEGDNLYYSVNSTSIDQNITINFLGDGIVEFVSEINWTGEDWVIFNVGDWGKTILSNNITLRVIEKIPDLIAPEVELLFPANDSVINVRDVELGFIVTDDLEEELSCELFIDGDVEVVREFINDSVSNFSLTGLEDGVYQWNVECSDGTNSAFALEDWVFNISAPNAPVIGHISNKNIEENETLEFFVSVEDNDGDLASVSMSNLPEGAVFDEGTLKFSWTPTYNQSGSYTIGIFAEDLAGNNDSESFIVTVNNLILPPSFDDAKTCEVVDKNIKVKIKDPDNGDDFEIGDKIEVEIEIENNADEDVDLDVFAYLYDLDEDEEVARADDDLDVDENEDEKIELEIEIPDDIDEGNDFAVYVIAMEEEDEFCNTAFVEVEIDRPDELLTIKDIFMDDTVKRGEETSVEVQVQNLGSDEIDVVIRAINSELGINVESEEFSLEEFDDDDTERKTLSFVIPQDAEEKEYTLDIEVDYEGESEEGSINFNVVGETTTIPYVGEGDIINLNDGSSPGEGGVKKIVLSKQTLNTGVSEESESISCEPEGSLFVELSKQKEAKKVEGSFSLNLISIVLIALIILIVLIIIVLVGRR